jgi:post-segregation antitoxin (ccd killing protein)
MPKINVYLPDDLAEAVRDAGVPVSAVCQRALEQAVRRVTAVRELCADSKPAHRM